MPRPIPSREVARESLDRAETNEQVNIAIEDCCLAFLRDAAIVNADLPDPDVESYVENLLR